MRLGVQPRTRPRSRGRAWHTRRVADRTYAHAWLVEALRERHDGSRAAFREAYRKLRSSGVKVLSYLEGDSLLGDDDEATTDGSHPSDLGMLRYADAYTQVLRRLL